MSIFDFQNYSAWLNFGVFAVAACAIWWAGTRLERYADALAGRTGLGKAFIGLVLLAVATSLPEITTSVTAVLIGNPSLAIHNLLGSVVMNTAVLAIADAVSGREALTHRTPRFVLIIQGLGVVFLLAIVLTGASIGQGAETIFQGSSSWIGVGVWAAIIFLAYLLVIHLVYRSQQEPRWSPAGQSQAGQEEDSNDSSQERAQGWSTRGLYAVFGGASLVVLVAGWFLTQTADALAVQTGLGGSFIGFTLVAVATTLPEISTTVAAARQDNLEMAISNIFGSSAFVVALLPLVGLLAGGEAVVQSGAPSALFAAALGILVVCIYLWGMLERRDRTVLHLGWDSAIVLLVTFAGIGGLYFLK